MRRKKKEKKKDRKENRKENRREQTGKKETRKKKRERKKKNKIRRKKKNPVLSLSQRRAIKSNIMMQIDRGEHYLHPYLWYLSISFGCQTIQRNTQYNSQFVACLPHDIIRKWLRGA